MMDNKQQQHIKSTIDRIYQTCFLDHTDDASIRGEISNRLNTYFRQLKKQGIIYDRGWDVDADYTVRLSLWLTPYAAPNGANAPLPPDIRWTFIRGEEVTKVNDPVADYDRAMGIL